MKKNILFALFCMLFLFSCSPKPEKAIIIINNYLDLRTVSQYQAMYSFFAEKFQSDISFQEYENFENLYKQKFGGLNKRKVKKWSYRKNFACGESSGKLVVIIMSCQYDQASTEETFTMINKNNKWYIFDYYLRPIFK